MSDVCAIVLAGGQGTRFGEKNSFWKLKENHYGNMFMINYANLFQMRILLL